MHDKVAAQLAAMLRSRSRWVAAGVVDSPLIATSRAMRTADIVGGAVVRSRGGPPYLRESTEVLDLRKIQRRQRVKSIIVGATAIEMVGCSTPSTDVTKPTGSAYALV